MRRCALLLIAMVGCGEEEDDFGTSGGSSVVEFEAEYTCCINGAFYECESSDAVSECIDGDTSGCTSAGDC